MREMSIGIKAIRPRLFGEALRTIAACRRIMGMQCNKGIPFFAMCWQGYSRHLYLASGVMASTGISSLLALEALHIFPLSTRQGKTIADRLEDR